MKKKSPLQSAFINAIVIDSIVIVFVTCLGSVTIGLHKNKVALEETGRMIFSSLSRIIIVYL
jgi:type III secretory pathway component EscV